MGKSARLGKQENRPTPPRTLTPVIQIPQNKVTAMIDPL